jgi:predicted secreted protein
MSRIVSTRARLLIGAAALATIATPLAAAASPSATSVGTTTYNGTQSGKTIMVKPGAVFKVHLHYCSDCGDNWVFSRKPAATTVAFEGRKNTSTAKAPAVGGENDGYWTFKAVGKGTTTIGLAEHSAEKKDDAVIKRFTLTVKVS